jgi:hypothetical protein
MMVMKEMILLVDYLFHHEEIEIIHEIRGEVVMNLRERQIFVRQ